MSFKDQINKFVGKVRISDIENAFNFIIENVNAFIDTINNGSEFLEDTDNFYLGSTSIPAGNYTLTLGALKKILTAYDKEVIGGTVVKNPLNTGKAILFPSLEISKDNGITQVMQTEIDKPSQADIETNPEVGRVVGYDTTTDEITNQNNVVVSPSGFVFNNTYNFEDCEIDSELITYESQQWRSSECFQEANDEIDFSYNLIGKSWTHHRCKVYSQSNSNQTLAMNNYSTKSFAISNIDIGQITYIDEYYAQRTFTPTVNIWLNINTSPSNVITTTPILIEDSISKNASYLYDNYSFTEVDHLSDNETGVVVNDGVITIVNNGESKILGFSIGASCHGIDEQVTVIVEPGYVKFTFENIDKCYSYAYSSGGTTILPSGQTNPDIIKIADIDWNRDEWVMNTTDDWLYVNPEQSPLISLTVQNPPRGSAVNPDDSKPQFIVPRRYGTYAGERGDYVGGLVRLADGSNIIDNNYTNWSKSRNRAIDFVFAPVWVPKGMASTIFPVYGCSIAQYYTLS